jgi:hypothetical protein
MQFFGMWTPKCSTQADWDFYFPLLIATLPVIRPFPNLACR